MAARKPKIRDDLTVVELDGEAVVYDEVGGELHHLNPSATVIFALCDGTQTAKEVSTEIASAYSMALDEVEPHVRGVIRDLRATGLLEGTKAAVRE